jgi:hypothetical protein
MEMLSVPVGKFVGTVALVLLFKTSRMLTFPAEPVGPELALPPQDASPKDKVPSKDKANSARLVNRQKKISNLFISLIFSFYDENKSDPRDFLTEP